MSRSLTRPASHLSIFRAEKEIRIRLLRSPARRVIIPVMTAEPRTVLAELDLLSDLPEAELDALAAATRSRRVAPGRLVVRRGEELQALYVVVTGEVEVALDSERRARIGPGALFGETALLADTPHAADVKALEETTLLELPRQVLSELFARHPARRLRLRTLSVTRRLSNVSAAFADGS